MFVWTQAKLNKATRFLNDALRKHDESIESLRTEHRAVVTDLKAQLEEASLKQATRHENKLAEQSKLHAEKMTALETKYEEALETATVDLAKV